MALKKYAKGIKESLGEQAVILSAEFGSIKGSAIVLLAQEKAEKGEYSNYYTLAPVYLRKPEAEITWEAKHCGR